MSYAKGKWSWDGQNVIDSEGWSVAEVYARLCDGETEANAQLIKASPAMYEALLKVKQILIREYGIRGYGAMFFDIIEDAISQAEGGE